MRNRLMMLENPEWFTGSKRALLDRLNRKWSLLSPRGGHFEPGEISPSERALLLKGGMLETKSLPDGTRRVGYRARGLLKDEQAEGFRAEFDRPYKGAVFQVRLAKGLLESLYSAAWCFRRAPLAYAQFVYSGIGPDIQKPALSRLAFEVAQVAAGAADGAALAYGEAIAQLQREPTFYRGSAAVELTSDAPGTRKVTTENRTKGAKNG